MLRAFILTKRKLLVPRPLPVFAFTSDETPLSSTAIFDVRRNHQFPEHHRSILPQATGYKYPLLCQNTLFMDSLRWNTSKRNFHFPDPSLIVCNMISMLKCVDLAHMKDTPSPVFWLSFVTGGAQVVLPLLEILGGYSEVITIFQLQLAAVTVATLSGMKWGQAISKNPVLPPNWDTLKWTMTPTVIALVGLVLPYPLGFLAVAGATVSSLYLNLQACIYSPWGNAVLLFTTLTMLAGLFMALFAYLLFHGKATENEGEKKERKEKTESKKDKKEKNDNDLPNSEGEEKDKPRP